MPDEQFTETIEAIKRSLEDLEQGRCDIVELRIILGRKGPITTEIHRIKKKDEN